MRKIVFDKRLKRLNKVHLPLLEMARTVKVTKEKAEKERAREAGNKRLAAMKKTKGDKPKESSKNKK